MEKQSVYLAFVLLFGLSSCEKIDEAIFPLAGSWKPSADRTTRIQYTSGGQTYDKSFTKTVTPASTLLVFGKDGTFTEGTSRGTYSLETLNGEKRVVITSSTGSAATFTYELTDNRLKMGLFSIYESMTAADRLAVGKALGIGLSSAAFPGLNTASSVQRITVIYNYTRL